MKNIGILTCLRAGQVCAGVSCLRAFAERRYFLKNTEQMFGCLLL